MALCTIYIKAGFSKAGIWPFSAEAPLKSSLVQDPQKRVIQKALLKWQARVGISGKILNNRIDYTTLLPLLSPPPLHTIQPTLQIAAPPTLSTTSAFVTSPIVFIKSK